MGTFANSEDPDEMLKNAAFHQGLHCLLGQNQSLEKELQYYLAIHQGGGVGGGEQPEHYPSQVIIYDDRKPFY